MRHLSRLAVPVVASLLLALLADAAAAQATAGTAAGTREPETPRASVVLRTSASAPPGMPRWSAPQEEVDRVSPGRAALYSALVPGLGQHVQGQRRAWAYLAVEAVAWWAYLDRRAAAHDLRDSYRDFAWMEARIQAGTRRDGDFDYYETLTKWRRSGQFDTEPTLTGVQPEADAATFNGAIWSRARRLFIPDGVSVPETDPRYQQALDYYRERAYGPEFLWDWTGTGDAQDEYASIIRASDQRFRQATNVVGLVVANHLVSLVDAFVSARVPATTVRSGLSVDALTRAPVWSTRIRIQAGW